MLDGLILPFQRSLRAHNRADKTIRAYVGAARLFAEHQVTTGRSTVPAEVKRADIEAFITDQLER